MLVHHIALVPEVTGVVDGHELARVSAALQRQVTRDFSPLWEIAATVDAFPALEQVPLGYWPVVLTARSLGDDEGFHLSAHGEPFSVVELTSGWSLTASHEVLEMLVDSSGARTIPGMAPDGARVEFLLEICDPCQSAACAYTVNDVLVSDFVTRDFFDPVPRPASRLSFGGNVPAPHALAEGGAISWLDHAAGKIIHMRKENGQITSEEFELTTTALRPLRAHIHAMAKGRRDQGKLSGIEHALKVRPLREASSAAMTARAALLRGEIARLTSAPTARPIEPSDADVMQRIDAALAQQGALDQDLVAFLQQARTDLLGKVPAQREAFALNALRSALRSPVRPVILTERDVPGVAQYDHEDIRWAKALWEYFTTRKAPFPVCPQEAWPLLVHPISDGAVIAIAGDWGTHNASSANIGRQMDALRPTHPIHLGDVYYAGTEDEERQFIRDWPSGSAGTFTLNSNHEMYSGGTPYFSIALTSDKFDSQSYSYFALSSSAWLFIGLDSAYNASASGITPYDVGHLPAKDPQVEWLRWLLQSPSARTSAGALKRICILTHHQALEVDGQDAQLLAEVEAALGRTPDLWYWGHIHGAAVYAPRTRPSGTTFHGRLAGHGGIPYISDFPTANDAAAKIAWAERSVGNGVGANGFAVLRLRQDGSLGEEFYDEQGKQHFSASL